MSEQRPKVSVLMITYNHERYIAQAIESALMQQTDFPFEIVIGEDCSTDRTRVIVRDFQRRFPGRIRLLLPERNLGMHENFFQTLRECRGQYIALLEGDDYWTSPQKLQKQLDFLDSHPDYVLCFHQVLVKSDQAEFVSFATPADIQPETLQLDDIVSSNPIVTCSVVFRNGVIKKFPQRFSSLSMVDWPLFILLAKYGKIWYIDAQMSVYRLHLNGVWSLKDSAWKLHEMVRVQEYISAYVPQEIRFKIQYSIVNRYYGLALEYRKQGDTKSAIICMFRALYNLEMCFASVKHWIGAFTLVFFPKIYYIGRNNYQ